MGTKTSSVPSVGNFVSKCWKILKCATPVAQQFSLQEVILKNNQKCIEKFYTRICFIDWFVYNYGWIDPHVKEKSFHLPCRHHKLTHGWGPFSWEPEKEFSALSGQSQLWPCHYSPRERKLWSWCFYIPALWLKWVSEFCSGWWMRRWTLRADSRDRSAGSAALSLSEPSLAFLIPKMGLEGDIHCMQWLSN